MAYSQRGVDSWCKCFDCKAIIAHGDLCVCYADESDVDEPEGFERSPGQGGAVHHSMA